MMFALADLEHRYGKDVAGATPNERGHWLAWWLAAHPAKG